jgi:hypothetical protein
MAKTLHARGTLTQLTKPGTDRILDLLSSPAASGGLSMEFTTTAGGTEITPNFGGQLIHGFVSERFATQTPLSGNLVLRHYAASGQDTNATIRLRMHRVLRGGTNETRFIGDFDGPSEIIGDSSTLKTWSWALPAGLTFEEEERMYVQFRAVPFSGLTMQAGTISMGFNLSSALFRCEVELPGTVTTLSNAPRMIPRSLTGIGIGAYRDLLITAAGTTSTAIVNTVTGGAGTEVQWTLTAGGTAAAWISERLSRNFYLSNPDASNAAISASAWALESATTANAAVRLKLFRYRGGAETLIFTGDNTTELGTSFASRAMNSLTGFTPVEFLEDDRIVAKFYIIPAGTMASGRTCSLQYDFTNTWIDILGLPRLKAEADAGATWTVPDGQSTLGIGN